MITNEGNASIKKMHNVLALQELKTISVIINLMDVNPVFQTFILMKKYSSWW